MSGSYCWENKRRFSSITTKRAALKQWMTATWDKIYDFFFFFGGGVGEKMENIFVGTKRELILLERNGKWFCSNEVGNYFVWTKWEMILFERNEKSFCLNEMGNYFVGTKREIILFERNGLWYFGNRFVVTK